jgi:hypothetical protein
MTYIGHVKSGVVVFDGPKPPEGASVRVDEIPPDTKEPPTWGEVFKEHIGKAEGPADMAANHDHYAHGAPKR